MNELVIKFVAKEAKPAWDDDGTAFVHVGEGALIGCAIIESGMTSGAPSVALRFELPDGTVVIAETSGRLFVQAAQAIVARHPEFFGALPCNHSHDEPLQAVTCQQVRSLHAVYQMPAAVAVFDPESGAAGASAVCNMSNGAALVRALCALLIEQPRPTDCDDCAEAHDHLAQALAILKSALGRCQ